MELSAVSLQNKFTSLEERLRAENETRNQDKMAGDSNNEMPFIRQGSGRRPGPLPLQPNGTPTRVRKTLDLIGISTQRHSNSRPSEVEARLQEIMKLTGIITIDNKKYHTKLDDLEHLGELGFGSCGHVVKMRHPTTGVVIAVKQMRRSGNREENKRITMDLEVVLKSHDCPYIVRCLGCFVTDADVWICMELMATCFDKLLKKLKQPLPEPIIGKVAVATIKALHYLKEKHGVIHRDVKPSNILLDEKGNVKLCDFGISGWLEDSMAKTRSAGCAAYMAPERIEPPDPSHPDYDIRADVWSLGITLVEMATGESPYCNCQNDFEVLARVVRDDPPLLVYSEGSPYSHELCSFVRDCLTKNYKHRPKYKKLMEHPFIKKYETYNVDVAKWYADVMKNLESSNFNRQSAQRNSQRFAPPSPSLRRVTSEPPPIPPRTPESQRKPLLARLASEPTVEGLDLQTVNGRITVVGPKPPPPASRFTPKPPNLPPRPAPTDDLKTHQRPHNPPTDLPGLPPRHPVVDNGSNGSTVARLAQKFNAKLSPSRSPKDPYEPFQIGGRSSSGESVGSATTTPLGRPVFSEPVLQRLSQIPVLSKWVKQDLKPSPQQQPQPGSLTTRRVSSDSNTARRYPPSSPQPQIPARRSSGSGLPLGSVSVPASPVLQTRHMNEVVGPGYGQQPLPRHLTPELQRRMFGQQ